MIDRTQHSSVSKLYRQSRQQESIWLAFVCVCMLQVLSFKRKPHCRLQKLRPSWFNSDASITRHNSIDTQQRHENWQWRHIRHIHTHRQRQRDRLRWQRHSIQKFDTASESGFVDVSRWYYLSFVVAFIYFTLHHDNGAQTKHLQNGLNFMLRSMAVAGPNLR